MNSNAADNPSRKINIEGMRGDACVKKVSGMLREIKGVTNPSVTVGAATFDANQSSCDQACTAIDAAGYTAHPRSKPEKSGTGAGKGPIAQHTGQKNSDTKKGGATGSPSKPNPTRT